MPYNFALSDRLSLAAHINPAVYDIIRQITTHFSAGTRLVMGAMVIKEIALETADEAIKERLNSIGKDTFNKGLKAMSYEEDIWYCGTSFPIHFGRAGAYLNPVSSLLNDRIQEERESILASLLQYNLGDPVPIAAAQMNGHRLDALANTIAFKETAAELKEISHKMAEAAR